ncbi:hypothetical protein L7F22_012500 [Adiantum nelumboides]|nr:hypothetical protein [Adiantum nelumboides]
MQLRNLIGVYSAGLKFFRLNSYAIQILFYLVYVNLQVSLGFLAASFFSNVSTATVIGYQYVFGFGLLGAFLFQFFVEDRNFSKGTILLLELLPGFSLYRGLYEFSQYSLTGFYQGTRGMLWKNMKDAENGMRQVFIIMFLEWLFITPVSFYLDQFFQSKRSSFMGKKLKGLHEYLVGQTMKIQDLDKDVENSKTDVLDEMIGLSKPTSGTVYIEGLDIRTDMDQIYLCMGVCPQFDLLWESLTGREHLLFYGRLKNLKGESLENAVVDTLRSVNLLHEGVGDKTVNTYSGGMKRRLSVAISLIGDPKVVYMDEPSAGLDPASRNLLWNVVRKAKQGRAIILTTHSMEEAETLCDRVGIFVKGQLHCIGNCAELKSRYGASYIFTISTPPSQEDKVVRMALELSPSSKRIYSLAGTQKFEISKSNVTIADVFRAVVNAKAHLNILAWGFTDTTLEDVFIKVVDEAS